MCVYVCVCVSLCGSIAIFSVRNTESAVTRYPTKIPYQTCIEQHIAIAVTNSHAVTSRTALHRRTQCWLIQQPLRNRDDRFNIAWHWNSIVIIYLFRQEAHHISSVALGFLSSNGESIVAASCIICHDDVIKWKNFPRYWPFVWGIHRSSVNSLHKGQWRGALMFPLICVWINGWVNNRKAGDLRCYHAHYDVTVMVYNE